MIENESISKAWKGLAYAGHGCCFACGEEGYLYGASPSTKHCLLCFEFKFNCTAPTKRRAVAA